MDFGDILDKWEEQEKNKKKQIQRPAGSGKKLNAPSLLKQEEAAAQVHKKQPQNKQPHINPMELWLRRYGVQDKDKQEEERIKKEESEQHDLIYNMQPEASLDLHGLTRDEAWERLDLFITECKRRGLRKVLLIHGKGNHSQEAPVLESTVRTFVERDHRLGAFGHPSKKDGGKGATWVIIRD
ncbi:MAG: Smr/MutS family protein [Spirochaetaceae bacterium]|nr:Smr/MutS family protein [Spirochaetaceae bacterium]MBO7486358.1 Smr/MutS family protein [Spirochaetaceae bacterium]